MQPASEVGDEVREWLEKLASTAPSGGCFVEVGVYKGGTAWHLAKVARQQSRQLYLYDTFEGIPFRNEEKGDAHKVGDFRETSLEQVQAAIPDAICVKGVFPASIVEMPPVAFAHVDCDQYQSVKDCIAELFFQRMMPGGIMVFDDYKCLAGATRAVEEAFGDLGSAAPRTKIFVVNQ